ncbi:MAG: OmpA family protein, partial [Burkholderiaceae bacterium]
MAGSHVAALALAAAAGLSLISGCAGVPPAPAAPQQSYVMLVASPDGSVGSISVSGPKGTVVLDRAEQRTLLDGSGTPPALSDEQIRADFAAARAAQPPLPLRFILYFETGTTRLTPESEQQLAELVRRAGERSGVDVMIIGHTDSVGPQEFNERLGLQRAQIIAA